MSEFNKKLKKIYLKYKDDRNPPVPIEMIREYLELAGEIDDKKENKY